MCFVKLASEDNWDRYKPLHGKANFSCLEVVVDTFHRTTANVAPRGEVQLVVVGGTQESTMKGKINSA